MENQRQAKHFQINFYGENEEKISKIIPHISNFEEFVKEILTQFDLKEEQNHQNLISYKEEEGDFLEINNS